MRTAGRLAFFPARVAARASRDQLALAADDLVPEVVRVIDRAFATTLPEELVQSAVRHKVVERVARELVASGALDRAVNQALASEQMRRAIREVVESPELRAALARQTTGLAEELVGSVRARAVKLDGRLARIAAAPFAGIATRAVAFAIDAAAVILIWASISSMVAVISSLVGTLRPAWLVGLLLGSGFGLLAGSYFVLFWSVAGQTPGMRLLRLRLLGPSGRSPSVVRSLVRAVATVISIVPLFAGYLPVLFDERRRGLPDLLAGTVVAYEGRELESETWGTPAIG
ncbi:MAG TPA: RDD family protein [Gaiellaceae bacterium]|nr:RDD family protein [Gaiellaceae bacterium]